MEGLLEKFFLVEDLGKVTPYLPFCFWFVWNFLSRSLTDLLVKGEVKGVQLCKNGLAINHLLFADDCFLFCKASLSELDKIMKCFENFCSMSGQCINVNKSEVFF